VKLIAALVASLVLIGSFPTEWCDSIAKLGATGVLGTALLVVLWRTIPRLEEQHRTVQRELLDRQDRVEEQRRDDSRELCKALDRNSQTLHELRTTCVATQSARGQQ